MSTYERYPMWLHHPQEQPAVLCDEYAGPHGTKPPIGYSAKPGMARLLPPVMVNNEDQEAYYLSRGYEEGPSTMRAWTEAQKHVPQEYHREEYPKYVNGQLVLDPQALVIDRNYPKWVEGPQGKKLVQNAAEEHAYLGTEAVDMREAETGITDADRAFLAEIDAAALEASEREPPDLSIDELVSQARALGLNADRRYSVRRLLEMIDEKQAENENANKGQEGSRADGEGRGGAA